MIAWPSALWMPVSMSGAVKVGELEDLGQERAKVRSMLAWLQDVVLELRRQGIVIVAEHPARSRAWKEPLLMDAFEGLPAKITEMCSFGLRRPDGEWGCGSGLFLRRPTRLVGPVEVLKRACVTCPGGHQHAPELGGVMVDGVWWPVGDFVGCYTDKFANAVIDGVEEHLSQTRRRRTGEGFYVTPRVAEESFMDADEDVIHGVYFDDRDVPMEVAPPVELTGAGVEEGDRENQNHDNHSTNNHDEEESISPWPESQGPPVSEQMEREDLLRELDTIPLDLDEVREDQNHDNHSTNNRKEEGSPEKPLSVKERNLLERVTCCTVVLGIHRMRL